MHNKSVLIILTLCCCLPAGCAVNPITGEDEQTADLAGLDYMVRAGYNPYAMVQTMQTFEDEQKLRPVEFLSTHPSPQNRIGYITRRIQLRYPDVDQLKTGEEEYRALVLANL